MHARAVAVISTAGCQSPLLTPPGMRLRQQRAGGRTVRAARSSQCPRRCAPAPPAAWGSWEACSLGLPSHQQPAGRAGSCECAWNRTWAVQWWWAPVVVRRRRTLTTARRLVMEIRCGIANERWPPGQDWTATCWPLTPPGGGGVLGNARNGEFVTDSV